MNDANPWFIPSKKNGHPLITKHGKWDALAVEAVYEIAQEEYDKWNVKISFPVLLMNLAGKRTPYFKEVSNRLTNRIEQKYKEKRHAQSKDKPPRSSHTI